MRKVLGGLIALALFVPVASAGPPPPASVDIDSKKEGGPWVEDDYLHMNVGQKTKSIFWRVRNQDTGDHDVALTEDLGGAGMNDYRVRWYRGDKDITGNVRGLGYGWIFASDEIKKFEATVKAKGANPDPICVSAFFDAPVDKNTPYISGAYINDNGVCG
jgi:hypothetical protein